MTGEVIMTCYSGLLRPGVELSWEKRFFENDTSVLDSGMANDEGIPHYVTSLSMLRYGIVNPIIVWAEEYPGEYNISPGRSRYFCWQVLDFIEAPIILIDRFNHDLSTHSEWFDNLDIHRESVVMDLVYRKGRHEAWPRNPMQPEMTAHQAERAIFNTEWDLGELTWKRAKREHPENRFPEYFKALKEHQGIDFYHGGERKYRWGWSNNRKRVDINNMKEGMEILLPHIGITW
jgi:hypothetical protein